MHVKTYNGDECGQLTGLLQRYIPRARAVSTLLPGCRGLELYLLNGDYPQHELSVEALSRILNYPAYWAFCWASGQVLARYLLENSDRVRGKRVLDFGSGSGVAGIAAAMAGAVQVIACDIDADARLASTCNARMNGVELDLRGDFETITDEVDVILVADVLYDRENLPWLEKFLQRAPQVLVADSRVRDFDYPGYRLIDRFAGTTLPDLDEFDEFRQVSLYLGSG
jgi:predicted nicotinamide N-methyase